MLVGVLLTRSKILRNATVLSLRSRYDWNRHEDIKRRGAAYLCQVIQEPLLSACMNDDFQEMAREVEGTPHHDSPALDESFPNS